MIITNLLKFYQYVFTETAGDMRCCLHTLLFSVGVKPKKYQNNLILFVSILFYQNYPYTVHLTVRLKFALKPIVYGSLSFILFQYNQFIRHQSLLSSLKILFS